MFNHCACTSCIKNPDHFVRDTKADRRDGAPAVKCWSPHNVRVGTSGTSFSTCTDKKTRLNPNRVVSTASPTQ